MNNFDLSRDERKRIHDLIYHTMDEIYSHPRAMNVAPALDENVIKQYARKYSFNLQNNLDEVLAYVLKGLKEYAVHTPHPGYFGLYNPRTGYLSILADYITAVFNPQLAAWSHSPYANEIERSVIEAFTEKLGYPEGMVDGTFCTAGAESNLTAVQCAINNRYPKISERGVLGLEKRPVLYCSSESHHSIIKAARTIGLGSSSVHSIPVDGDLKMDLALLRTQVATDIAEGKDPFMVVATAGTTGSGAIDDIRAISTICAQHDLWLHVDAAFGGGAIAASGYKYLVDGIEKSQSVTLDLHKWFSVPMATSLFLTSHPSILYKTYNIRTAYMPENGDQVTRIDPYLHSIQWSRRFNGLRIFLPLAVHGWEGYSNIITRQIKMGDRLRRILIDNGWKIVNTTKLPVVCFTHRDIEKDNERVANLVDNIVLSGKTWVSTYPIHGQLSIRACITNYATTEDDLERLVNELNKEIIIVRSDRRSDG